MSASDAGPVRMSPVGDVCGIGVESSLWELSADMESYQQLTI